MATVSYVLGTKKNTLGEVQIVIKLFVSQKIRPRVQTGVWVSPKRWGRKNEITIPVTEGSEKDELLKKKELLSEVTEVLLDAVSHVESVDNINKEWAEDCVAQFHKQRRKARRKREPAEGSDIIIDQKPLVTIMQEYPQQKKMSKSRFDHFSVLLRCVMRFELYRKATGTRNNVLYLDKLTPEILTALESFIDRESEVFDDYPEIYEAIPPFIKQRIKTLKRKPKKNTGEKLSSKGRPKPRGINYVSDLMIRFRTFIIWTNDEGLTRNNPFRNHPVAEPVYGDPIYIHIFNYIILRQMKSKIFDIGVIVCNFYIQISSMFIFGPYCMNK